MVFEQYFLKNLATNSFIFFQDWVSQSIQTFKSIIQLGLILESNTSYFEFWQRELGVMGIETFDLLTWIFNGQYDDI